MLEKQLRPIHDKDSLSESIFKEIDYYFFDLIYRPILEILQEEFDIRLNAKSSLSAALEAGRVRYADGYFTGMFNASVSRELRALGATFDKTKSAFKLPLSMMDVQLRSLVSIAKQKEETVMKGIQKTIDDMDTNKALIGTKLPFDKKLEPVFKDLNEQFKNTVTVELGIEPELPLRFRKKLSEQYTDNINLYIKNWSDEAIARLRQKVNENFIYGYRADTLLATIKSEYDVSKRKARFLARQETSLLVSAYRQTRYQDAGIDGYRWSSSHDSRVRPDHAKLSGRIFTWDTPPITDSTTGARNHPGQDFNCRCVAIPVYRARGGGDTEAVFKDRKVKHRETQYTEV